METRDLYKLGASAALAALVACAAGYVVCVTTHSDVLLALTMLVFVVGPAVPIARWSYRLNRRAGSDPVAVTPATIRQMLTGFVLLILAFGGTYAAYSGSHDRWFEGLTAFALAVPNVAYHVSAAAMLPPLKRHEVGQVRLSVFLFLLLPLLFIGSLASWLGSAGHTASPVMRDANVAMDFVIVFLGPVVALAQRRRYLAAKQLGFPFG